MEGEVWEWVVGAILIRRERVSFEYRLGGGIRLGMDDSYDSFCKSRA